MLDNVIDKYNCSSLLDIGCGSGILGIVGVKLGVNKVVCFDNDFKAARETMLNTIKNNAAENISIYCGYLDSIKGKFDIIVANIYAEILIDIKQKIKNRIAQKGILILSGITTDKKDLVIDSYTDNGFKCINVKTENDWVSLLLQLN